MLYLVKKNMHGEQENNPKCQVIYALTNTNDEVFYVGRSKRLKIRMSLHQKRFGKDFAVRVLQDDFADETPADAEKKWIRYYRDSGTKLMNSQYNDWKPLYKKQKRGQIAVPMFDLMTWKIFKDQHGIHGITRDAALEEAFQDWILKSFRKDYKPVKYDKRAQRKELIRKLSETKEQSCSI